MGQFENDTFYKLFRILILDNTLPDNILNAVE